MCSEVFLLSNKPVCPVIYGIIVATNTPINYFVSQEEATRPRTLTMMRKCSFSNILDILYSIGELMI